MQNNVFRGPNPHISAMQTILILLIAAAAFATLYVLVKGVIGMAQNTLGAPQADASALRSQALMRKRVMYQAAAILVAVLLMMMGRAA